MPFLRPFYLLGRVQPAGGDLQDKSHINATVCAMLGVMFIVLEYL